MHKKKCDCFTNCDDDDSGNGDDDDGCDGNDGDLGSGYGNYLGIFLHIL